MIDYKLLEKLIRKHSDLSDGDIAIKYAKLKNSKVGLDTLRRYTNFLRGYLGIKRYKSAYSKDKRKEIIDLYNRLVRQYPNKSTNEYAVRIFKTNVGYSYKTIYMMLSRYLKYGIY